MSDYLKIVEVAEKFGVDRNTVTRWARQGIIPSRRISQKWFFTPEELERWVERSRRCRLYLSPDTEVDLLQFENDELGIVDLVRPGKLLPWGRKTNLTNFTVFIGTIGQAETLLEQHRGIILKP
jgi:excisionase family DNA binding protein